MIFVIFYAYSGLNHWCSLSGIPMRKRWSDNQDQSFEKSCDQSPDNHSHDSSLTNGHWCEKSKGGDWTESPRFLLDHLIVKPLPFCQWTARFPPTLHRACHLPQGSVWQVYLPWAMPEWWKGQGLPATCTDGQWSGWCASLHACASATGWALPPFE